MKQVYKCDFCPETSVIPEIIIKHEPTCSFNPTNKFCYSCKHNGIDDYRQTICKIGLSSWKGKEEGNCEGWELEK
jgi:hypothetical protein